MSHDALRDGEVCDEEFRVIMEEVDKYETLKAEIRAQSRMAHVSVAIDEKEKKALIQRGRDEARASMIKAIATKTTRAPAAPAP